MRSRSRRRTPPYALGLGFGGEEDLWSDVICQESRYPERQSSMSLAARPSWLQSSSALTHLLLYHAPPDGDGVLHASLALPKSVSPVSPCTLPNGCSWQQHCLHVLRGAVAAAGQLTRFFF